MQRKTLKDLEAARLSVVGSPRPHDPNRVAKSQCPTCPWRTDGHGLEIPDWLRGELALNPDSGNQYCHSPAWKGEPEDVICRGHRDHWAQFFYRNGLFPEPTDQAWADLLAGRAEPSPLSMP